MSLHVNIVEYFVVVVETCCVWLVMMIKEKKNKDMATSHVLNKQKEKKKTKFIVTIEP